MYSPPRQSRAVQTEQRFLQAFEELLLEKSFNRTTIQEIAERASLDKGAFLKRFGTKKKLCYSFSRLIASGFMSCWLL